MDLDVISFVVGAISSIFIPFLVYVKNYIVKKWIRRKFKLMINKEYVEPLSKHSFNNVPSYEMKKIIGREARSSVSKLEYLKEKELTFLATENQFYFLRVVIYTNRLLQSISEYSNSYEFRDTLPISSIDEEAEKVKFEKKIHSYIRYYELNIDKYANLKIDKFQAPD